MVVDGFSAQQIRDYLQRFLLWWVNTSSQAWSIYDVLDWFVMSCWHPETAAWGGSLLQLLISKLDRI